VFHSISLFSQRDDPSVVSVLAAALVSARPARRIESDGRRGRGDWRTARRGAGARSPVALPFAMLVR
jgi:hypothetical protein